MSPADIGPAQTPRWTVVALISGLLSVLGLGLGYAYMAVPGPWFEDHPALEISGASMVVTRGNGTVDNSRLILGGTSEQNLAIISLETSRLDSEHYRRVSWKLSGLQPDLSLSMLWRTDFAPGRINSVVLEPSPEGAQAWLTPGESNWVGHIQGLALTVKGTLQQPLIVEGVRVESFGLSALISERFKEWFHFSTWSGLSINTAIGGEAEQRVWLPLAISLVTLIAIGMCVAWWGWRGYPAYPTLVMAIGAIVLVAWITLDARWLWTRIRQTQVTAATFSGKSLRDKEYADFDAEVFGFAEQVMAKLPSSPARVYVTGDDPYLRGRLAYHLYPNNVFIEHLFGALPPPAFCKPGEYIAVIRRHGVEYDPLKKLLRWDGQTPVHAELLLQAKLGALFRIVA